MSEIILPVPGYEAFYSASNLGRVFSNNYRRTGKMVELAQSSLTDKRRSSETKYRRVKAYQMQPGAPTAVHRIIALTFCPNPHGWNQVNHINGDKSDNRAANLEWCSISGNITHAIRTGLLVQPKGEEHGMAILTEQQVAEIRNELRQVPKYKGQLVDISRRYGVSKHCIFDIRSGRSWTHSS